MIGSIDYLKNDSFVDKQVESVPYQNITEIKTEILKTSQDIFTCNFGIFVNATI